MTSQKTAPAQGEVLLYKNKLEVRLKNETVWLTQAQIANLFGTQRPAITKHISNIFKTKELNQNSVCSILEHTAQDGKSYRTRFYNLDAIISIGYRVNSTQATQFRIWATQVLKKHLINGYTLNQKRLEKATEKYRELKNAIGLLSNVASLEGVSQETKGIAQVISEYTRALDLLDDFDHERLKSPKGIKKAAFKITYEEAQNIIAALKKKFKTSSLVGQEKDGSFKSSLGTIYQTFGKKDLYPSVQQKAAHLLYFVTKNHSFVDGNKRIAAALFICFLERNKLLSKPDGSKRIDENALVALTLMIAASKPQERELMIKVILNLLC